MCGMIVEDQPDCGAGRIGGIEQLEEFNEFAAAMAVLDQGMDLAGDEVDPGQQADRAVPLIFMITGEGCMAVRAADPGPLSRSPVQTSLSPREGIAPAKRVGEARDWACVFADNGRFQATEIALIHISGGK